MSWNYSVPSRERFSHVLVLPSPRIPYSIQAEKQLDEACLAFNSDADEALFVCSCKSHTPRRSRYSSPLSTQPCPKRTKTHLRLDKKTYFQSAPIYVMINRTNVFFTRMKKIYINRTMFEMFSQTHQRYL